MNETICKSTENIVWNVNGSHFNYLNQHLQVLHSMQYKQMHDDTLNVKGKENIDEVKQNGCKLLSICLLCKMHKSNTDQIKNNKLNNKKN